MTQSPSNKEIAERISAHLARFESDPQINPRRAYKLGPDGKRAWVTEGLTWDEGSRSFWKANAYAIGRWVNVVYYTTHGATSLSRERALAYLLWLDAGNIGTHFQSEGHLG